MKSTLHLFALFLCLLVCLPVLAQQSSVREIDNVAQLANQVQDLNRTRFVRGYTQGGDGGGGTFIFTNTITATNIGTRFRVTGQAYSWERVHDGRMNIRWFGARDNATDNSSAIQATVDYAMSNNFTVFIPPIASGAFTNTSQINIPSNASLLGEGPTSVLYFSGVNAALRAAGTTNIVFSRFKLTGAYTAGIELTNVSGVTVKDCAFTGATRISGGLTIGPIIVHSSQLVTVDHNDFRDNSGSAAAINFTDLSHNCIANDNTINSPTNGISISGGTNIISNNQISVPSGFGVIATAGSHNQIFENTVSGTPSYGIYLNALSSNNIVTGNRVYNNLTAAIEDFGAFNTIAHNTLMDGNIGIDANGDSGLILPNVVIHQLVGLQLGGTRYRVDTLGRSHENTIPINDPGGSIIHTLTTGATPSVRDSEVYLLSYAVPTSITGFTDGLIGMRRTFFASNTNAIIKHNANITLDGAGDFHMRSGDALVLERETSGTWRQVGKSVNTNWMYYDRSANQITFNSPIVDSNTYVQVTSPSAAVYPEEHVVSTNTTASALIARWLVSGNVTPFALFTSADKTNVVLTVNGITYQFPRTNGVSGQVLASDGTSPQKLYWTNSTGGGSSFTFDPTQFSSAGGLVAITNGALTTNLVLKGAVTAPVLDVSGVNIDAATGTEFSKELASNTSMGILNMTNGQALSFTVTNSTFTLSWTNAITWISGVVPVIDTNAVNVFHFFQTGGRILGSDPERLANANLTALASMPGIGVVVKTNSTSFSTFNPLPVRYGGTGTNTFATVSSGNIPFYDLSNDVLDNDDSQFLYDKSNKSLYLARTVPTGTYQLFVVEGSGTVPALELYANAIKQDNDNLTIDAVAGSNILAKIAGTTALKVSQDKSVIVGGGSTTTTRTNEFFYLTTFAGIPTGVPHTETGTVAMGYDTVNKILYAYEGGWNPIGAGTSGIVSSNYYPKSDGINFIDSKTFEVATAISPAPPGAYLITSDATLNPRGVAPQVYDLLITSSGFIFHPDFSFYQLHSDDPVAANRNFKIATNCYSNQELQLRWTGANAGMLDLADTSFYTYAVSGPWVPSDGDILQLRYDSTNLVWREQWRYPPAGGSGSTNGANWVAVGTTDSRLPDRAHVNNITSTNGFVTGAASFTSAGLALVNAAGPATVNNSSGAAGSSLVLQGGAGVQTYVAFKAGGASGATTRGTWDTNGILNAFYGTRTESLWSTNGIIVGAHTATNLGVLYPSSLTNGLLLAGFQNKVIGDPAQASISYAVATDITNSTEQASFVSQATATNSQLILLSTRSDGTVNSMTLNASTNGASLILTDTPSSGPVIELSLGPSTVGGAMIELTEGSGVPGVMTLSPHSITVNQTNFTLAGPAGFEIQMQVGSVNTLRATTDSSVVIGDGTTTTTRTNKLLYVPTFAGVPTGIPHTETGTIPIGLDSVNTNLYGYVAGGWRVLGGSGGGGGSGDVVAIGVLTNGAPILGGGTTTIYATNAADYLTVIGAAPLSAITGANMTNTGASAVGMIPIATDLTGTQWTPSDTIPSLTVTTLTINNALNVPSLQATNGVTILDVQATNIVGTDANQKLTKVNVGAGLVWTPGTMTISSAGGGALAGTGEDNFDAIWTSGSLTQGAWYFISTNQLGFGGTNSFLTIAGAINNLGLGENALANLTSAAGNLAFGRQAGQSLTDGGDNVILGYTAAGAKQSASKNVAIGRASLGSSGDSYTNTFVGWYSGNANNTGNYNVGFGAESLRLSTSADYNSALGTSAGYDNLTGNYNTYLGALAGYIDGNGTQTLTNTTQVGFAAIATNNNAVVLGNQNVTRVQFGTGGSTIKWGTGSPESIVQGNVGDLWIRTDGGVGTTLYGKTSGSTAAGWSAFGSSTGDNWLPVSGSTTNSFLNGNATVSRITSTNGFITGSASFSAAGLALANGGGAATVNNSSGVAGSSLVIQGGAGLETFVAFKAGGASGATTRGTWDTNGVLNAFFGAKAASMVVTNSSTIGIGTSGAFARVPGVAFVNKTSIGNVLTGEDDMMSYPVAGGTLAVDKDTLRFRCSGQFAANGNSKQVKAYFGAQQLFASGALAFNATDWVLTAEIIRDGATAQIANVTWASGDTLLTSSAKVTFPAETLSGTVVFKLTGEATASNDIVQKSEVVEYLPTP
jgi:hypothetical protein